MLQQYTIFFDFLRFCIGSKSEIPSSLKEADWKELYRIAQKQCLVGILFDGIQKLPPAEVGMSKDLLLQWMMQCQMLEKANVRLNDAAIHVSEWFGKKGFRTCILKGQGNALMYPNPYSRTLVTLTSGWKGATSGSSPLSALSLLMKRRAITISSSHRIRVLRWKCIIALASCCASGITESFRIIMRR